MLQLGSGFPSVRWRCHWNTTRTHRPSTERHRRTLRKSRSLAVDVNKLIAKAIKRDLYINRFAEKKNISSSRWRKCGFCMSFALESRIDCGGWRCMHMGDENSEHEIESDGCVSIMLGTNVVSSMSFRTEQK